MIDKISNKILNFISTENIDNDKKEVLLFGITRIVEDIPKTIGIILIGIILGILKEIAIVTIVLATYKTFVGGVHAKTNLGCFIYSVIFYLAIIYSARYINLSGINQHGIYLLIYIFSVYTIVVYVPADVIEIPKINLNLRRSLKIKAFIVLNIIYVIALVFISNNIIKNLLIYYVFYIGVMTTRTIYKLFKTQYGFEAYIPE